MPDRTPRLPVRRITRLTLLRALTVAALSRATYSIRVRARAQHPGRRVRPVTL